MIFVAPKVLAEPVTFQVDQSIPQAGAAIGVGSPLTLQFQSQTSVHSGMFLGVLDQVDGKPEKWMLLDLEHSRLFLVDTQMVNAPRGRYQQILHLYDQVDGTCTAYAMKHYFEQLNLNGLKGNRVMKETFSSEKGRTQFLARTLNDYYISTLHRTSIRGIMATYGRDFGLQCEMKHFKDAISAERYVLANTIAGNPVLIAFDVGPNMVSSDISIVDFSKPRTAADPRLWIPRKIGERASGGHSVVAVASFAAAGKNRFLMLDSDWATPRIWNADEVLGGKTDIEAIEFHVCK
jgi:hypothetical protein